MVLKFDKFEKYAIVQRMLWYSACYGTVHAARDSNGFEQCLRVFDIGKNVSEEHIAPIFRI